MIVRIEIQTGNAAFDGVNRGREVARILREEAQRIEDDGLRIVVEGLHRLKDVNGNAVGDIRISREP